jgi:hypothetical protein
MAQTQTMTPKELVSRLAPVELERLRLIFLFLAANAHELRTNADCRLLDASDWKEFLHEVADELAEAGQGRTAQMDSRLLPRPALDHTCPDCGHEHEDKTECKKYLGEGRFCPCESKVTA